VKLVFREYHDILIENLGLQRVAAKFVPCLLTEEENQTTFKSVNNFLTANNEEKFLKTYYGYDVETESHSLQWVSKTSHRPKRARKFGQMRKVLFTLFFGVNVLFTMNCLPRDQTINKEMKCLRQPVRR
jgi:hypothetical protein